MSHRNDLMWAEQGDDYTPATDLIFSLFAMTVLLLALFGAGDHVARVDCGRSIGISLGEAERLRSENRDLKSKLDTLSAQCPARAGVTKPPAALPVPAVAPSDWRQQLDEARAEAERYRQELAGIRAKIDYTQLELGTLSEKETGSFMNDSTNFSAAVRDRLVAMIGARARDIETLRVNQLVFELGTSAARGASEDGTDLDLMETMIWSEALMRAMRATPLPVGCLAVEPVGKLRSVYVAGLATAPGAGKSMNDFERMLKLKQLPPDVAGLIRAARFDDRHITVWARSNAAVNCDPDVLSAAIAVAARPR